MLVPEGAQRRRRAKVEIDVQSGFDDHGPLLITG
jgi:hypothetical protein